MPHLALKGVGAGASRRQQHPVQLHHGDAAEYGGQEGREGGRRHRRSLGHRLQGRNGPLCEIEQQPRAAGKRPAVAREEHD